MYTKDREMWVLMRRVKNDMIAAGHEGREPLDYGVGLREMVCLAFEFYGRDLPSPLCREAFKFHLQSLPIDGRKPPNSRGYTE